MKWVTVSHLPQHEGETVELRGWVQNYRSSGKIQFIIFRDGTGVCQAVLFIKDVPPEVFEAGKRLTQESSIIIRGTVRKDDRAPGGYEIGVQELEIVQIAEEYPITPKEHGTEFLMDHRHLWVRSSRQAAILRIRNEITMAIHQFLQDRGFVLTESPILMGTAAEGGANLFETTYVNDEPAFLSQSGQLYVEATAMALGRVYTFGPTFRAEKSKTRRHLIEFWMVEPEAAYFTHEDNMKLQEEMVSYVVQRVLERRAADLKVLGRDTSMLEKVKPPFPRITYTEAVELLKKLHKPGDDWEPIPWGEDFGAPHETVLTQQFDKPVFVEKFPVKVKAFYMQPDPENPEVVLGADLLAPEGYGEIIGGSERIHDPELLKRRFEEHGLDMETYGWYYDLRRFGSVPHSGFGLGIERTVAWICGLEHVRETIPFPRLLNRLHP
ncbi:asparaginyl-tRNA synthetase [Symbiobacterium terraclitae]|uniref:Asparagine--tRNA ligase n=1 Tax=Symbiobacterium terraclitae TaxID=557451 RepID=A0ABS4JPY1_9FIRM|nr:asparagine--tRNA ligase [Symbiobacterium terraclitae]MBP2017594.1 asparaginyl-tRNA synthetase [Symbiobacterium terraclitae]